MKQKDFKNFIKIYQLDNRWIVDYIGQHYSDSPLNLGFSDESKEDALYKALIYLAVEFMKFSDIEDEISHLYEEMNSYTFSKKYEDLRFPNLDTMYEFIGD